MKRKKFLVFLFLFSVQCIFARSFVGKEQDISSQVQSLTALAREMGHYVKNDWCHIDDSSVRNRWVDFFNRLILISKGPHAVDAYFEFYKQTLFEIPANDFPNFHHDFSSHLPYLVELQENGTELMTPDNRMIAQMASEYHRWMILMLATAPSAVSAKCGKALDLFHDDHHNCSSVSASFPDPPVPYYDHRDWQCQNTITEGINNASSLKLGTGTILMIWHLLLSP